MRKKLSWSDIAVWALALFVLGVVGFVAWAALMARTMSALSELD